MGYNAPASAGAALANKRYGRISVAIQGDGDLMFVPGTLWTAAHHRIPILYVVHNNRAYHQEYMYRRRWPTGTAAASQMPTSEPRSPIRTSITPPWPRASVCTP